MSKPDTHSLNIEDQFNLYMKMVGLEKLSKATPQYIELKRAYYGACGQMLVLFRDVIPEIEPEESAVMAMEGLMNQVETYWKGQL